MKNIRKIFYECIVPEAAKGKVNVFLNYSVAFSTRLVALNKLCKCTLGDNNLQIPTLIIKDREEFDMLLNEYVIKALNFYDDDNFCEEILDDRAYNEESMICKEKDIIVRLFANATYEDFCNPNSFLKKRIDFIDNYYQEKLDLGYSECLKTNLEIDICGDTINNEATQQFIVKAYDDINEYIFPHVKFGISGDTVYIYAIQNADKNDNDLAKKINRRLYKVGEGFVDMNIDENPKDVTASFLVALNMAISYFRSRGYNKIQVPSMLMVRWNAKQIINNAKYQYKKINLEEKNKNDNELETIQYNLTNKLIRTFLRLGCHYNNIDIVSFPYEIDSSLHLSLNNDIAMKCNNSLLYETSKLVDDAINNNLTK